MCWEWKWFFSHSCCAFLNALFPISSEECSMYGSQQCSQEWKEWSGKQNEWSSKFKKSRVGPDYRGNYAVKETYFVRKVLDM